MHLATISTISLLFVFVYNENTSRSQILARGWSFTDLRIRRGGGGGGRARDNCFRNMKTIVPKVKIKRIVNNILQTRIVKDTSDLIQIS